MNDTKTDDQITGRPLYLRIPLSLRVKEDKDIIEFLDGLGRGNISPWMRGAIRAAMAKEQR